MDKFDYDVIVIGAGAGGLTASIGLSSAGKKVALIEEGLMGGDCTNYGCVPSKAFIDIAKNPDYKDLKSGLEEVRRRRKLIQDEETVEKIEKYGIKVLQGTASFKDQNTVLVNEKNKISAKNIIISTGSHPIINSIEGLKKEDLLTNETVFELKENIKDLVVIGGGYIGCELAESFSDFGVNVTIIQRNIKLIPREELESSHLLEKIFTNKGINILTNTTVEKVVDNKIIVVDKTTNERKEIKFDKVLVALGRGANTDKLELQNAGIKPEGDYKKGITVNSYNKTSRKNIFAVGDCVLGNPQFTHWANNEARGVIRNILFPYIKKSVRNLVLPSTLYTSIEISRIGKTEAELLKFYNKEDIITEIIYFDKNDRSKLTEDMRGFIKINFKRLSGKILGATIAGTKAGEMLPVLTMAMQNNISAYKLSKLIYSYPTKSELIKKIADRFVIKTLSNIKKEIKYFFKNNILQIITGIIWLSIVSVYFYFKSLYGLTNLEIAKLIYNFVLGSFWGPILYIFLYAIRPIVLFPATFMTFMSGAIFGIWWGLLYTIIGENLSANFAYLLGKIFGKKIIKNESNGFLASLKNKINQNAFLDILIARLLFFPFDLVNYASGILKIKWRGFFLGTLIGSFPGMLVFIIAGASIENIGTFDFSQINFDTNMIILSIGLFVASLLLAKFLKKKGF